MNKRLEGFKTYKHASNPKEKELHDRFIKEMSFEDMDYIVFGHSQSVHGTYPDDYLSDRERKIVVSTIQWLGSPVGHHFLRNSGFCEEIEYSAKERLFSKKIASLEDKLAKIPKWIKACFK